MLITRSKVRRILCYFFDDCGLLGVILELLGHLILDKMSKGQKRVLKGRQNGGSEAPLGAARSSLRVTWEAFGHPLGYFGAVGATLLSLKLLLDQHVDFVTSMENTRKTSAF